jgi:hypothetical protein
MHVGNNGRNLFTFESTFVTQPNFMKLIKKSIIIMKKISMDNFIYVERRMWKKWAKFRYRSNEK